MERLQKALAAAGVSSRRHAEALITAGRVTVNGEVVTLLGARVDPERDVVAVDGTAIARPRPRTLMLNKPAGYLTARADLRGRQTVMALAPEAPGLHPIGRLDKDTSGLLLFTNDGRLTYALTHPKHGIAKTYHAWVAGGPDERALERLRRGGIPVEGRPAGPAQARRLASREGRTLLEITIHEGRKRQVRRMCQEIGHPVVSLRRVRVGPLSLGELPEGQWRDLGEDEVRALYRAAGMDDG